MKPNSIKALGVTAFLGLSTAIGAPLTLLHEGMELVPKLDSAGVKLSWCGGETDKKYYKPKFNIDECNKLYLMQYGFYSLTITTMYNDKAKEIVTPEIHAAVVDTGYNIGLPGIKKSSIIGNLNVGNALKACGRILAYKYVGKRDCSKEKGLKKGCYGVYDRRIKMNKLCLSGI